MVLGAGILGRVISLVVDGIPSPIFLFFIISELAALVAIYAHTRRTGFAEHLEARGGRRHAGAVFLEAAGPRRNA